MVVAVPFRRIFAPIGFDSLSLFKEYAGQMAHAAPAAEVVNAR
jgi:hypothetical protein